jgi:hypothetical protein
MATSLSDVTARAQTAGQHVNDDSGLMTRKTDKYGENMASISFFQKMGLISFLFVFLRRIRSEE